MPAAAPKAATLPMTMSALALFGAPFPGMPDTPLEAEGDGADDVEAVVMMPPKTAGGTTALWTDAAADWYASSVCVPEGFTTPDIPERQCERRFFLGVGVSGHLVYGETEVRE